MSIRLLALSSLSCLWCLVLLIVRREWSGQSGFTFMLWNLFLAGIPLGFSLLLQKVRHGLLALPLLGGWLLFFPNAPYVLTDLIHLRARADMPLWFDLMLLLSFGLAGLWLGFQSLRIVHHWLAARTSAALAWAFVLGSLMLSGFGIYLGRFLRWNSWDILRHPQQLLADVAAPLLDPFAHPRTWGVTLGFGFMLVLAYLFWTLAAHPAPAPRNSR